MSTTLFGRSALLFGCAVGALAAAGSAAAQTAPADPAQLDEIVVTAERRSENLQDVPVSVGVVQGDQLRAIQAGGGDILELAARVPGLYAETTTGRIFPRFYIRGLGNIDFYLGASQPVSIIQDDVVLEHVVLKSNPLFDIAQVEVLRGPQGSLFGRNTTAGIIKFDTNRPTMDWQGRASASYGSYNTVTFDGGVGGPIVADKLAFRVSALYQRRDDWVDNVYDGPSADGTVSPKKDAMGGFEEKDVRLQLLMAPSDMVSMLTSVHARDYEGTSTIFHRAGLTKGSNSVADEPRSQIALDEAMDNPQAYKTYGASEHITLNLGGVTLTSITAYETTSGYSRGDTDGGAGADYPVNGVANGFGQSQGNVRDLDQLTQEIRLASDGDGRFKWQVGGLYFDQRDTTDFYQRAYFLTGAANNPNNWVRLRNKNESWALFGQASYELAPGFTLTAGGRYTKDIKETRLVRTAANAAQLGEQLAERDLAVLPAHLQAVVGQVQVRLGHAGYATQVFLDQPAAGGTADAFDQQLGFAQLTLVLHEGLLHVTAVVQRQLVGQGLGQGLRVGGRDAQTFIGEEIGVRIGACDLHRDRRTPVIGPPDAEFRDVMNRHQTYPRALLIAS